MIKEYEISKSSYRCCACQTDLAPGSEFVATVCLIDDQLIRKDYCPSCRAKEQIPSDILFGQWQARVPHPVQKKRLLVDDELLISFFHRLENNPSQEMIQFRFVLALVLMRKKLLVYDRLDRRDGQDLWIMHFKGDQAIQQVLDPHLDEQKISQVSIHLGRILEGDL